MGNNAKEVYITYTLPPDEAVISSDLEEELLKSGTWDDWDNAQALAEASRVRKTSTKALLVWNGSAFKKIDIPISEDETIDSLYMDEKGVVYLAGGAGVIAAGNDSIGFSLLAIPASPERIISIAKLKDTIYYVTNSSFMKIENANLVQMNIAITDIRPLKLDSVNGILFYFDRQAKVALFDGKGWKEVPIPPELLRRDFGAP